MIESAHIRIARPTDQLELVSEYYKRVIGFSELGRFEDHDGFDGIMLGYPGANYHLELTKHANHVAGQAPSQEHLLVIYIPNQKKWIEMTNKIEANGGVPVTSFNPYWDLDGKTYQDPDGYRIVIQNSDWNKNSR